MHLSCIFLFSGPPCVHTMTGAMTPDFGMLRKVSARIHRSNNRGVKYHDKMDSRPGSPSGRDDKVPSTSWMFSFGGFTDSPHPHKYETRGLDTIQATSFFHWWLLLIFQAFQDILCLERWGKGRFVKKIRRNHRSVSESSNPERQCNFSQYLC